MKKKLCAILFLGSCFVLSAQSTLTKNKMMSPGSTVFYAEPSDISVIDTTLQGENIVWDFTGLTDADPTKVLSTSIETPENTPYASTYPTSNYVQVERNVLNGVEQGLTYNYFSLTDTKMERLGRKSVYTSSASIYSDPQVEYVFPLTYNTENNDTWASDASSFGGTYHLKCIGYGALKLPSATYNNVLLVRALLNELFTYKCYFWYNADNGAVLAVYENMSFFGTYGMYATGVTLDVKEKTFIESIKYNNPVDNNLYVRFGAKDISEIHYEVINTIGSKLLSGTTATLPSQENTLSVDVNTLNSGMYFLKLSSSKGDSKQEVVKFIKK